MNHFSDYRFFYGWDDDDVTVGDLALDLVDTVRPSNLFDTEELLVKTINFFDWYRDNRLSLSEILLYAEEFYRVDMEHIAIAALEERFPGILLASFVMWFVRSGYHLKPRAPAADAMLRLRNASL